MNSKNDLAEKSAGQIFRISRTVDAPREWVWRCWTEPERAMKWWGPKGSVMKKCKFDLRPGGIGHYLMQFAGQDMWGKFAYREILKPERLVWINSFSDEKGGTTRHPLSPTWPLEMLTTVTFSEKDGRTTIAVEWKPYNPTAEEMKTFEGGHDSMRKGWSGTFSQLEDYLITV